MTLIKQPHNLIKVRLSDRIFNDTIIKQEATFIGLDTKQNHETGECTVRVDLLVKYYANDNGELGIALNEKGMLNKLVTLVADNNTLVDASTGAILAIRVIPFDTPEWLATVASFEQAVMYQGDFFEVLRTQVPIVIDDLIREHITQADTVMHKFD